MDASTAAKARRRFLAFLAFLAATSVLALFNLRKLPLDPGTLRETVLGWGALAPLAYMVVVAMRPFVFFPSTVLFIAAGLAFGPYLGALYAVIGGVAAALLTFLLARSLGREFVQARLPVRLQHLTKTEWGAGLVFVLYLVPVVPITAVNYGAGLSSMPLAAYALAVLGGLTPRAFAYTFLGDSLLDAVLSKSLLAGGSRQLIAALAVLALLVLVPLLFRKHWSARWQKESAADE